MPAEKVDLVIEGGTVLTMVEGRMVLPQGRVVITGDRIAAVGPAAGPAAAMDSEPRLIDARGAIVMPGLVNAHTHAAMTLFRGYADDLPLREWLFEKIFPAEARYLNPDSVYRGSLLACLEMIASGTTCLADGYFYEDETFRAVEEAGLRGLLAQGVIDFPAPGVPDPKENLRVAREYVERWNNYSARIRPGLFCHSPLTCEPGTLQGAHDICLDFGLPLQLHLSETAGEVEEVVKKTGKRPVRYLDELGLLDSNLVAVHAVHLDDGEMALLAERGVRLVHAPESNMKLASGVARVSEMVRRGMTLGLGTDGASSNNDLDLFAEMDAAAKLSKVFTLDPTALDAKTALRMATCWGARILGLEDAIGSIEAGKKADLIVVETGHPHLCPLYDPFSALVYSAGGADVRDVVVDGRVLMRDRRFTTLDADAVMQHVNEICSDIA
jgi:5-methylthioadenosine/S-adenosylhomocysteine deaminase